MYSVVPVFGFFETTGIKNESWENLAREKGCQHSTVIGGEKRKSKKIGEVYLCGMWVSRRTADNGS